MALSVSAPEAATMMPPILPPFGPRSGYTKVPPLPVFSDNPAAMEGGTARYNRDPAEIVSCASAAAMSAAGSAVAGIGVSPATNAARNAASVAPATAVCSSLDKKPTAPGDRASSSLIAMMATAFNGSISLAFRLSSETGFGCASPTIEPVAEVTMATILALSGNCSIAGNIVSKAP